MDSSFSLWFLRTNTYEESLITGQVSRCEKKPSTLVGLKKLAKYWLIAVFCIFIPVLHFILVPIFLFVGVLVLYRQLQNSFFIKDGTYICPFCSEQQKLLQIYFNENTRINCENCGTQLSLFEKNKL